MYVKLPFLGHHSDKLRTEFQSLFYQYFPMISFKLVFVNDFKIFFFIFKERHPKEMRSISVACSGVQVQSVACSARQSTLDRHS